MCLHSSVSTYAFCVFMEARGQLNVFLDCSSFYLLRQDLLLNPELTNLANLASGLPQRSIVSAFWTLGLWADHHTCLVFMMMLQIATQMCMASTLSSESSPKSPLYLNIG